MKDKILNTLVLLTVAAALVLTLARGRRQEASALPAFPAVTALPTQHPAESYRRRREETRRQERETLLALSENEAAGEETRQEARARLLAAAADDETELAVEAVLAARGYDHALCVCRDGKITLLADRALEEADAALILHLVQEISAIPAENIRVSGY